MATWRHSWLLVIFSWTAEAWLSNPLGRQRHPTTTPTSSLFSTPFEADLYDNPFQEDDDDDTDSSDFVTSPLAVADPDTPLVLGINKYSHDTAICAAHARTGEVLYAQAKERIDTRTKHDAGNIASLVETCMNALDLDLSNIEKVVMNNHHHRIQPLEASLSHMEWECGLFINGGQEDGYTDDENLLPDVTNKMEISHHLAHAYSAAAQAPMENGLIVIMDGMGETYRTMTQQQQQQQSQDNTNDSYVSDFSIRPDIPTVPSNIDELARTSRFDWREAESVYTFSKNHDDKNNQLQITPIFKRFTQEHSPPVLYNHGFENMDSLGALYSRASSHIFGNWNACGKVMGLAPWAESVWKTDDGHILQPTVHEQPIVEGCLYKDDGLTINRSLMQGVPFCARTDPDLFDETDGGMKKRYDFDNPEYVPDYKGEDDTSGVSDDDEEQPLRLPPKVALDAIALASRMQTDLETVAMDFVKHFQQETGQENLVLAGGVALNSVLNGRLSRELGFQKTFIPPYPGDDGIAVGCCAYALYGNNDKSQAESVGTVVPLWKEPLTPYLGGVASETEVKMALEQAGPWIEVETIRDDDQRYQRMVDEIASGGVIAWFRSRSEMGPRALGHRSILADPRKHGLVRFINEHVKSRESFRPFAPSCLADEANEWFDLGNNENEKFSNVSPFMSLTAQVKAHLRHKIPAVTHVDGSSRLQTVRQQDEPMYYAFISKFFKASGIPMVLNTSFNTLPSEPIVETPMQAIRSFLYTQGNLEMLVMDDYVITRKSADLRQLLGEVEKNGKSETMVLEPSCPKRAGSISFQSSFTMPEGPAEESESDISTTTKVQMPDRILHIDGKWHELTDELEAELLSICDGSVTLNEILAHYTSGLEGEKDLMQEDTQQLLQNVVQRLSQLYDQTFLYW